MIGRVILVSALVFIAARIASAQNTYALPLRVLKLSSAFGSRLHPVTGKLDFHKGVDLQARSEPVFAILPGKVSACGYHPILGNFVRIVHGELESIYGHLSSIMVQMGKEVKAGEFIGVTGDSGRATGEHLHFSICFNQIYIDPLKYLFFLSENNSSQRGCDREAGTRCSGGIAAEKIIR
ncbi:M23 family metallopeptidase [Pedobacter sp. GSP4]|uniref:M23 family metallopeptidase n=1 Tax=Pedobacter sp. GSP4 TaxID=3453716 RepID=UPI003EEDEBB4